MSKEALEELRTMVETLSVFEVAEKINALVKENVPQKDIANAVKKSSAWVSLVLKAYKCASPELLDAWKQNKLKLQEIMLIARSVEVDQPSRVEDAIKRRAEHSLKVERSSSKGIVKQSKELLQLGSSAPLDNRYIQGMLDMARFIGGDIGAGEFAKEWRDYLATKDDA